MLLLFTEAREIKRHGRPVTRNRYTDRLANELASNQEALVAVYREGLRRRVQPVPDQAAFDQLRFRTVFGSIKRLEFYALPLAC